MARLSIIGAAAALALAAAAAQAHHGWSAYSDQESQVSGVVEEASFGQPHGLIRVKTAQGPWTVMLAPPAAIQRAGLTLAAIPKGTQVTARGHKRIDGTPEIKTERLVVGSKTYDLYPGRD
jgi:hypothetical protein